jgi:hypothetical protein
MTEREPEVSPAGSPADPPVDPPAVETPDGRPRITLPPPSSGPAVSRPAEPAGMPSPLLFLDRVGAVRRRRERIIAEVRRGREGDHLVPTWLLAVVVLLMLVGVIILIVVS